MSPQDGAWDSPNEAVTATVALPAETGVYNLCVRGTDSAGNTSDGLDCTTLVVYDPDGGFVTGGGWIESLAGAYKPDPTLSGKANFGFVSKYKKGKVTPDGQAEFVFQAADMNFHSSSYDWLVVMGKDAARFKGQGTINGMQAPNGEDYMFTIRVADGEPDTFQIKILLPQRPSLTIEKLEPGSPAATSPVSGSPSKTHSNVRPVMMLPRRFISLILVFQFCQFLISATLLQMTALGALSIILASAFIEEFSLIL